jgi:YD repeat-containing protein
MLITSSYIYVPDAGFAGTDYFSYVANDGAADSNTATVTIHVTNTAPTASNEFYQVDQDDTLSVAAVNGVLANAYDADGDTLAANIVSYPTHGYFILSSDGSFTYSPDPEFEGTDRFSYYANDGVSDSALATVRINVTNLTPGPGGPTVLTPDAVRQNQEQVNGPFYSVALASGELTAAHSLPAYNGRETLQLVYDSESVAPNPVFLVRYTLSDISVPDSVGATLTLNGVTGDEVFFDTTALSTEDTVQIALQADGTGLPTGRYAYQVDVTAYFSTPTTDSYLGYIDIINNADSPFGAGWSLQGLDRLWPVSGGAILEMAGGVSMWFADGETTGTFVSPASDFSTLTENIDGSFTRVAADGMTTQFASSGLQTAIVDRNGNTTTFTYDSGKLTTITDPFESEFTFDYDGDQVVQITDPAGRSTALGYDGSLLVTITDPDPDGEGSLSSPMISLAYDLAGKLTDWTDPNSNTTTFSYNIAGRVETITRPR